LEDSLMLMGKHTRKRYRMGDRVEVKIMAANPTQRQIDLVPASMEVTVPETEEAPARTKRPKKLKDASSDGTDPDFLGRPSAPSAAVKAAEEATKGKGRRQRGKPAPAPAAQEAEVKPVPAPALEKDKPAAAPAKATPERRPEPAPAARETPAPVA